MSYILDRIYEGTDGQILYLTTYATNTLITINHEAGDNDPYREIMTIDDTDFQFDHTAIAALLYNGSRAKWMLITND